MKPCYAQFDEISEWSSTLGKSTDENNRLQDELAQLHNNLTEQRTANEQQCEGFIYERQQMQFEVEKLRSELEIATTQLDFCMSDSNSQNMLVGGELMWQQMEALRKQLVTAQAEVHTVRAELHNVKIEHRQTIAVLNLTGGDEIQRQIDGLKQTVKTEHEHTISELAQHTEHEHTQAFEQLRAALATSQNELRTTTTELHTVRKEHQQTLIALERQGGNIQLHSQVEVLKQQLARALEEQVLHDTDLRLKLAAVERQGSEHVQHNLGES
jgi:hypothetical protein